MAFIVDHDQRSNCKYFCRICKKGFVCGRALGGHMRAHGVGVDESKAMDEEEDPASDWEDKLAGSNNNNNNNNKCMYALRTNPNRLKSCRVCEHCGKEFLSWKSFLEHIGRCTTSDDAESLVSSPGSDEGGEDSNTEARRSGWSKRKRSMRAKIGDVNVDKSNFYCPSSEEEDLANCLMMLSNSVVDPAPEPEESCASASKDEEFQRRVPISFVTSTPTNIAYRVLTSDNKAKGIVTTSHHNNNNNNNKAGLFECKACKKVFNSHQALGGHRASHKKVKGCFASRLDHLNDNLLGENDDVITHEDQFLPTKTLSSLTFDHGASATPLLGSSSSKRKSKVHKCSICNRIFSSGQALGGHKRCHWITSNSSDPSLLAKQFHHFHMEQIQHDNQPKFNNESDQALDLNLDLNLPAPRDNPYNNAAMYLQSWLRVNNDEEKNDKNNHNSNNNDNMNTNYKIETNNNSIDDEADSKVKLAKLSDLKDMNVNGNSSPWLQVGIGSTTDHVGSEP